MNTKLHKITKKHTSSKDKPNPTFKKGTGPSYTPYIKQ